MSDPFATVFPAPAKINRFLQITGRRPDGYHELQTVFQFVGLQDELRFSPLPGGVFELDAPAELQAADNLCLQAARIVSGASGRDFGVRIELTKRIPVGGGLGGGSSDAATTLVALNHLFGLGLELGELVELALKLGADVPVFVHGRAAWAEGVGDRLVPVEPETPWALLIDPGVAVSTATMFRSGELTRDCPAERIAHSGYAALKNVFEPLARRSHPRIDAALHWLEGLGVEARLSGTGGCLFGLFATEAEAQQARSQQPDAWRSWVVRLCNRSPLCAWHPGVAQDGAVS
ncbi:4-diphosphocytidyl-2-C-methyl-D-erythritol kinase [Thioalkalivibrio nitratireducens DSM 14787]|uniref:4-diphosphocytidyl-2-C-methyl-D-erythritol kinase n=1 Tax=Thioalkalivibrio nitratireducens (strain DSM 14787 / UNIQEM 213 / ALEN2) TaxID=1255043 RepID=L0DZC2_THIND|nr:4-(cytidine 5'-diphospho)-2-C-methyl-D-erythritol kinase [Thioalkalivibrio nitratireducens]AGA34315.1 4-diphosphocytidyl-2-C-methyl-D-erythritol kinase [Thioalkalivibrio nitratireducens DSM 14787]